MYTEDFIDFFTSVFNQDDFSHLTEQEYIAVVEDCEQLYNESSATLWDEQLTELQNEQLLDSKK